MPVESRPSDIEFPSTPLAPDRAVFVRHYSELTGGEMTLLGDEAPRLLSHAFGRCRISAVRMPAFVLRRTARPPRAGGSMVAVVRRSASSKHETAAGRLIVADSALLVASDTEPSECGCDQASERLMLHVPNDLLAAGARAALAHPLLIPGDEGGVAEILRRVVASAIRRPERLDAGAKLRLQRSLVSLLVDVIESREERLPQPAKALTELRARALSLIEAELGRLDSLTALSERLGCSPRSLHKAFSERGQTPADVIWSARLERAREQLLSAGSETSVTEIAFGCGFQSYSHFSRAFRKRFGCAPQAAWASR